MNFLVFNQSADSLKTAVYGSYNGEAVAVATDEDGNFVFSPDSLITVTASNLDIRDLTAARDTVTVTASNFDIRDLNGDQDSVQVSSKAFVQTQTTVTVAANTTTYLLVQEIGGYSDNSFFLRNTNAVSGSITVTLQVAPTNSDSYYVSATATSVGAASNYLAAVATLMRYARLQAQTGGTAVGVDAYYNGRA